MKSKYFSPANQNIFYKIGRVVSTLQYQGVDEKKEAKTANEPDFSLIHQNSSVSRFVKDEDYKLLLNQFLYYEQKNMERNAKNTIEKTRKMLNILVNMENLKPRVMVD